ncbi:MAG TPA: hypothetical protein VMH22_06310 [bacterium]|nr:hypothetical protein [bacterium]
MISTPRAVLLTAGYVIAGLVASTAVGYLGNPVEFFHSLDAALPFLVLGLMGALIYASVQMGRAWYAVLVIVLWCLVRSALTGDLFGFRGPAAYAVPIGLAFMVGTYAQKSLTRLKFGRFIGMALIVGFGHALYMLAIILVGSVTTPIHTVLEQTFLGLKLGAATGLGFELVDLLWPRLEEEE